MNDRYLSLLEEKLLDLEETGLYKKERIIESQQQALVKVMHQETINLCANNYLGLANDKDLIQHGKDALDQYGYGMASVRFICGTQTPHKELEKALSNFLKKADTILYSSCFDANTGLFETLFSEEDAVISDSLNHASIIDGVRLCKAQRYRYANNDMQDLELKLKEAKGARFRCIATDGVFSMDGTLANLPEICELAQKYDSMVMVDDSHAVGFMGEDGRGTAAHFKVEDKIDILTGTLGKALGGASGGYTSAAKPIIDWLRQRSRPYLFSNTLAPMIAKASVYVLAKIKQDPSYRSKLFRNTQFFRDKISALGFNIVKGEHPIIPVMLGEAKLAQEMAALLLEEGVYVIGFSYPVVLQDKARIRVQMSAALEIDQLEKAIEAFAKVGKTLGIIGV
ncbi:MAG: glycine C-acetyltransferase [Legionellales bacterium RIFCSPHIGHO2_12_FULL_37_14]|nr:MAG: glycine C-acetyltransferase [Legionellales bacterium RIFCSPHIGHO2_12_FULL_37_14]